MSVFGEQKTQTIRELFAVMISSVYELAILRAGLFKKEDCKEKEYSPSVRAIAEIVEITKGWDIATIPFVPSGDYFAEVWVDKNNTLNRLLVLYEKLKKKGKSVFPVSYAVLEGYEPISEIGTVDKEGISKGDAQQVLCYI